MKLTDLPSRFTKYWGFAAGGSYIRNIPEASQIGINPGYASLDDGFVPLNFTPVEAGGIPPYGQDFNGILRQITQQSQWNQAGGPATFDATFVAKIGGYPKGAVLASTTFGKYWLCSVDDNANDPASTPTGWIRFNLPGGPATTSQRDSAGYTYVVADLETIVQRINTATGLMTDTIPGATAGAFPAQTTLTISNQSSADLLVVNVGTGSVLKNSSLGYLLLGPSQSATVVSDGTNYWVTAAPTRCRVAANTTFYVASTGSDSANGLSAATAKLTLQAMWNYVVANFDIAGKSITIDIEDGTYTGALECNGMPVGVANGTVSITGNTGSPSSVVLNTSTWCIRARRGAQILASGITFQSSADGLVRADDGGSAIAITNCVFGAAASAGVQIFATEGGTIRISGSYTINGGAGSHYNAQRSGVITTDASGITVTVSGTPAFSVAFAVATEVASIRMPTGSIAYSGSATGARYSSDFNSSINVGGGGASFFPGNSSGATANGGVYA